MKLLHFLKTSDGARWAFRQLQGLLQLGYEVHVVLPPGRLSSDLHDIGAFTYNENVEISLRHPFQNPERLATISRIVRDVNPDIIHSHFVSTTVAIRIALGPRHSVKRVFHVPGPLHLEHPILSRLEILLAGPCDYWLASCMFTREKYISLGIPASRLGLVYYGVNSSDFNCSRTGILRRQLGLRESDFLVGNVSYFYPPKRIMGQMHGIKGHEDMLLAIQDLIATHEDLKFVFIGSGFGKGSSKYFRQIKKKASKICRNRIFFTGYRNDVGLIYPDLDLAVHPSHSENVGGAVESLMSQVPTLCTDVGGFPDLITQNVTGWLCPPKNASKLADAIRNIYALSAQSRKAVARNGSQVAAKIMDISSNVRDLAIFYDYILNS